MASSGGAGSGSGAGAAGWRSKRPKKDEADKDKWQRAKEEAYGYQLPDRKFDPVDHPEAPAPVGGYQKPPILVFFNAKGGTLKTSHTWNTACTMSSVLRGLRVLTVDMDSQQDLTRSLLKAKLRQQANGGALTTIDQHLGRDFTDQEVETYADHTLGQGHIHFGDNGLTRTLEGALHPLMGDIPYLKHVVPEKVADNLFLLPGSKVMEDIDRRMTIAEGQLNQIPQRNWQGAPVHVIMQAAKAIKADIVLLDLNPSLSTINRNMLMSSDYIVVTTRPEDFSLENMDTFMNKMVLNVPTTDEYGGSWLQQMIYHLRPRVNEDTPQGPARYPLPETVPKVLGCVIADYSSRNNVENTMNLARPPSFVSTQVNGVFHDLAASAIDNEMNSITARMRGLMNDLSDMNVIQPTLSPNPHQPPATRNVRMTIGRQVYVNNSLSCLLAKIRSYESLGPLTHHFGVAAPFIRRTHCVDVEESLKPKEPGNIINRAADFKRRYDQLAWNILKLMNSDPDGKLYGRLDWALKDRREGAAGPPRAGDGCPEVDEMPNVQPGY